MAVRLDFGSGVTLELDHRTARRVLDQLTGQLETTRPEDPTRLPEDHPIWSRSSGGAGHHGNPWNEDDEALAEVFYRSVSGKGRLFFDILLDRPGQLITSDEIVAASGGALTSSRSVAGAIKGLYVAHKESDRIYPFTWWEGQPTRYAVRPSVAALFNKAREKGDL